MQTSRNRRHRLTAVAMVAAIGLGANGLAAVASSGSHRVQSLGAPTATTSSLPATDTHGCATVAGCDLYATNGTVTAGTSGPINIWGFTFNTAPGTGELGGSVNNTIVIGETDTLRINLHNALPAGAGNLSLEVPAAQGAPTRSALPSAPARRSSSDLSRRAPMSTKPARWPSSPGSWPWVWPRSSSCGRLTTEHRPPHTASR